MNPKPAKPQVGRPRRGTESARADLLISAATQVFVQEGYGGASIDKVAAHAGVSTRTIYERFKNKADLMGAVVDRLIDRDMATFSTEELNRLDPRQALTVIGNAITGHASEPDSAALFRIVATEAQRFPELAAKMRTNAKNRIDAAVARYLGGQVERGVLRLADPVGAAALFLQMVVGEIHECLIFGRTDDVLKLDFATHLQHVVDIFLHGALPRHDEAAHGACDGSDI